MAKSTETKPKPRAASTPSAPVINVSVEAAFANLVTQKKQRKLVNPDISPESKLVKKYLNEIEMFRAEGWSYATIVKMLEKEGVPEGTISPTRLSESVVRARSTNKRRKQRAEQKANQQTAAVAAGRRR